MRKIIAAAVLAITFPGAATAGPLITQWGFSLDSGFTTFAPAGPPPFGVEGFNTNAALGLPSGLRWGDGAAGPFSSLVVGVNGHFQSPPNVFTDGAALPTVTFTHNNTVLSGSDVTLSSATLEDVLTLTPVAPPESSLPPLSLFFNINFHETPNLEPCVAPSPAGNPCDDIIAIDVVGAGFNPIDLSFNQNFSTDGNLYNAKLFLSGLGKLTDAECADVLGPGHNGCIGLTTVENAVNDFQASLQITSQQFAVPEPATLLLFGFGLTGLAIIQRRRATAKASA